MSMKILAVQEKLPRQVRQLTFSFHLIVISKCMSAIVDLLSAILVCLYMAHIL